MYVCMYIITIIENNTKISDTASCSSDRAEVVLNNERKNISLKITDLGGQIILYSFCH